MKHPEVIVLISCMAFLTSCESTDRAGQSKRAEKREMANRQAAQQQGRQDEAQQNLENAQRNVVNRDGNPMRGN